MASFVGDRHSVHRSTMYYLWNAEKPVHDAPRINYLQALLADPYWNRPSRPSLLVDLCLVSVSAQEFFSKKNRPTVRIQRRRAWDGWCQGPFEALLLKAPRCYSAVSEPQAASGCELGANERMGQEGFEPSTKGFRFVCLSALAGLCLHRGFRCRWVPSSLYTFPCGLGSALSCALLRLDFADFDTIPCAISQHSHGTTFAMSPLH